MENLQGSATSRAQLDRWMDQRRHQLRLKWSQVADLAGMGTPNLLRIRKGQISISWSAADGIEDALQWERGSVEAAVAHGTPPKVRARANPTSGERPRGFAWTAEMEAFYQILKAKFASEGLEMNEANVLSAIDQLRIELARRVNRKDRIPDDSR